MQEFKVDDKLTKKVWSLLKDQDPSLLVDICDFIEELEITPFEAAANIGYDIALTAKGRPVYAVPDNIDDPDINYFFIGTPEEILKKIKEAIEQSAS